MTEVLNNIQFSYFPHILKFKFDAGTSRGVLRSKKTYFLKAKTNSAKIVEGWGEAAPLPKLSIDHRLDFEDFLAQLCSNLSGANVPSSENEVLSWVQENIPEEFPSIRFAFEVALLDLFNGGKKMIFDTDFYQSQKAIPINGLIWMGEKDFMLKQINEKLEAGFDCIKMKIGAIDFDQECELLAYIRERFDDKTITLRVDANGAFSPDEALNKLERLSAYDLHSIEQPIRQGQLEAMAELCKYTPVPIALDEELIGKHSAENMKFLLQHVKPQYIILKPTLVGGIFQSNAWIKTAEEQNISWWMTSALESNIGLNAIAQFTCTFDNSLPQGLGTGQLYHNNIPSPLDIYNGTLRYKGGEDLWDLDEIGKN
ncbi:O-succinylbenzoate synthase [Indibacter alkaliphilus LW1]|uniref:o-succinylbenzoate synthase n=1 Tax=Indibacter alkaliphilus (strain CCUG 57479 / KCTC 22604 / LW1) TaxID=1189612 RepID=S2DMN1_INDAL|nr:o-succinylbenzoate synthase [Indibacter alkaliphilus]EOZ98460.1 O-succinylbenzoate synthase [Indibacter alkaliphilus LW1]